MRKISIFLLLCIFFCTSVWAANTDHQIVEIKLHKMAPATQQKFQNLDLDVLHWDSATGTAKILIDNNDFTQIQTLGITPDVLLADTDEFARTLHASGYLNNFYSCPEILSDLETLQTQFPNLISVYDFGDSYLKTAGNGGHDLLAVKISDNVSIDESEPEVLFFANMHAREMITTEVIMQLIHELLDGYHRDPFLTRLINEREIWLIPTLNPDGHQYVLSEPSDGNVTAAMWWRKNMRDNDGDGIYTTSNDGVDLNRNFDYKWAYDGKGSSPQLFSDTYRGRAPFSEPETQAFRQFVGEHEFLLAVDLHSSGQYIFYPWGYRADIETEHHTAFAALADSCARYNGYLPTMSSTGYAVNGGADDWLYGEVSEKNRIFPFTIEVGHLDEALDPGGFFPKPEFFEKQITENIKPMLFLADATGQMPDISVVPMSDYEDPQITYETRIQLTPAIQLTEPVSLDENGLWIYFNDTGIAPFDSARLEKTGVSGEYTGRISGLGDANRIFYYYKITDINGLTRTAPRSAPEKLFEYRIMPDTIPPIVSAATMPDIPYTTEQIQFCVEAEDNVGIDRVLAHIRLNGRDIDSFEMTAVDAPHYQCVWNYSGFAVGDIIEYYFEVWDAAKKQNYTRLPEHDFFQLSVANQQLFDLEGNWGLIASASGDWQHGTPKSGPEAAYSGQCVWATNLSGNYSKNTTSSLLTQRIDLSDTRQARLTFWQWYAFEAESGELDCSGYDGGNILISVDNAPFEIIEPENGYNMTLFAGLSGYSHDPVFSGQTTGDYWHQCTLNLTQYVGHQVRLRFDAISDRQVTYPGWYLDDFKLILSSNMPPILANVTRMPKKTPYNGPTPISAVVLDDHGLVDVTLHYTTDRISEFRQVSMTNDPELDDQYNAVIPRQKLETYVKYYVTATDLDGLTTYWPDGAPKKGAGFEITNDVPQVEIVFDVIMAQKPVVIPELDTLLVVNRGQQPLICTVSETLFTVMDDMALEKRRDYTDLGDDESKALFSIVPRQFSLAPADTIAISVRKSRLAASSNCTGAILLKSNDPVTPVTQIPFTLQSASSEALESKSLPLHYALEQNYPNPFNPETSIRFHLPTPGLVKLQVYNARGQLIQTVFEGNLSAGTHQQNWRAVTPRGTSLSSGVYFVRITAGDFTATRKMLLLR